MTTDAVLINILQDCVGAIQVPDPNNPSSNLVINYQAGRSIQIITDLISKDNAPSQKGLKYPLFALIVPVKEKRGGDGFYSDVKISRIVIMYSTKTDTGTETVLSKYSSDGVFATVLRPIYVQFLQQLAINPFVNIQDADLIVHTYMENPCQQPVGEGITDYVDSIELFGLEFILNQIKNC